MAAFDKEKAEKAVAYYYKHQPTTWAMAMREAGFSSKVTINWARWKNGAAVKRLIKEAERKVLGQGGLEAAELEEHLQKIIKGHGGKYIRVAKDGSLTLDFTDITDEDKALIKEVQVDETKRTNGTKVTKTRVIMHDKLAAIRQLGMMKGLFKDQVVEHKGEVSLIERVQRGRQVVCDMPKGFEVDREKLADGHGIN